ncbi:MAG TPA: hypothetical protein VFZ49_00495 [Pyrinomonadaceae bacterium]
MAEADTTPPDPAPAAVPPPGGWQMPEPKFQKSSGYLPQGYLDRLNADSVPQMGGTAAAAAPAAAPPFDDVEPQPDVLEQIEKPVTTATPPRAQKVRSKGTRIALILLGVLGMIAFITVFLGVIYYLFLLPENGGSTF